MRRIPVILTFLCCLVGLCGCSDKKDVGYYFDQGKEYFQKRNFLVAIESFKKGLEIYPDYQEAYYEIGKMYFNLHEYGEAIPYFKRAIELDNGSFLSYHFLADCLLSIGKFEEAERTRQKALKLAHFYTSITQSGLAFIYGIKGDYNKAIEERLKSMEYGSNTLDYYHLGSLYFQIKDYQQVIDSLASAKGLEKLHPDIHYMRTISFLNLKKKDQAIEEYEKLKYLDAPLAEKLYLEISQYN